MMEENKKENISEEIKRAKETLNAADLLGDNGFYTDAVSKLYYFLLCNVRAILLTKGLEPKSHEGALRLFCLHFVKKGLFKPKDSHIFSKLMKYREEADYNPSYSFTKEDFIELRKEAEELAENVENYLRKKGYL
jgi:uncharacterized protein (UPF0332 family)